MPLFWLWVIRVVLALIVFWCSAAIWVGRAPAEDEAHGRVESDRLRHT